MMAERAADLIRGKIPAATAEPATGELAVA
jgi:hypothetical protein